ncbi:hypothetical protein [Mesorhizobium kowhaii]|uniref:hypothetical protein n=1 Tax=Mesorhizobium kowhaii TaxID=1300272 RepID=UPI001ABF440E|nr:hypothetical protein [Mesorhizobium kowhaii]
MQAAGRRLTGRTRLLATLQDVGRHFDDDRGTFRRAIRHMHDTRYPQILRISVDRQGNAFADPANRLENGIGGFRPVVDRDAAAGWLEVKLNGARNLLTLEFV